MLTPNGQQQLHYQVLLFILRFVQCHRDCSLQFTPPTLHHVAQSSHVATPRREVMNRKLQTNTRDQCSRLKASYAVFLEGQIFLNTSHACLLSLQHFTITILHKFKPKFQCKLQFHIKSICTTVLHKSRLGLGISGLG